MLKLIAIDMDGTLLDDNKNLSEDNINSLEMLFDRGVEIVIATGRSYEASKPYIDKFKNGVVEYLICNNGATVYNLITKQILVDDFLTENQIREIIDLEETLDEFDIHFVGDDKIYTYKNPIGKYTIEDAYISFLKIYFQTKDMIINNKRITKALITAEENEIERIISNILENYFQKYNIVVSSDNYIEILNKNIDKGHALRRVVESMNLNKEEVVAIGDQQNDIGMFKIAGTSYAMLDASKKIKAQADYVGPSNNESGVAKIISKLIEMEKSND